MFKGVGCSAMGFLVRISKSHQLLRLEPAGEAHILAQALVW